MSNDPPKKRALATTQRALHNPQSQHDSSAAEDAAQGVGNLKPLSKFELLWLVPMPAARKLVAMAMANHSDANGGGIYASYLTLGWMTDIKPQQVGRHVEKLIDMGVVRITKKAVQRYPAHYAINLHVLADLAKKAGLEHTRHALEDRSRTYSNLQTRLLGSLDLAFRDTYPLHPSGEEERAGSGPPASPGAGPGPYLPDWWPMHEWQVLIAARPRQKAWLGAMRAKGLVLHGQGATPIDIAEQFLFLADNRGCKELRVKVSGPSAAKASRKRAAPAFDIPTGSPEEIEAAYLGLVP